MIFQLDCIREAWLAFISIMLVPMLFTHPIDKHHKC